MRTLRAAFLASLSALFACSSAASVDPGSGDDASVDLDALDAPAAPSDSPARLVVEPDDGEQPLLNAIANAKSAVHVEAYMLTESTIVNALVSAKRAGRDVKVVLEQNPYNAAGANNTAYNTLKSGGVAVTWVATAFTLTHTKTIVLDPGEPTGELWVMSLNLSKVAFTGNRDYALVDDDPADVLEAEAVIGSDYANVADSRVTKRLVVSPEDSRAKIGAMIDAATKTIDVEMEEMSDVPIVNKLEAAQARGVTVRVVVPATGRSTATTTTVTIMAQKGVLVRQLGTPDLHAKAIVVDGTRAYVGSINLTQASLDQNREIGLVTSTPAAITRLSQTIASDVANGTAL
jgi:phosphatidylserine/phosphatidylglycerophosphate/cardiolipin synthase-like enzyme